MGVLYTSPCMIRIVMSERVEGCAADQLQLGNDVLVDLRAAANLRTRANGPLARLYRRLTQ